MSLEAKAWPSSHTRLYDVTSTRIPLQKSQHFVDALTLLRVQQGAPNDMNETIFSLKSLKLNNATLAPILLFVILILLIFIFCCFFRERRAKRDAQNKRFELQR